MKLIKSLQAMFLKWNEAHLTLIQVLGKHGSVLTHGNKVSTNLMKVHYFNPFIKKGLKVRCVYQWLVQMEAFIETKCYVLDVEWFHSIQTLLKDHALN
jgi:hypothetical protein